MNIVACCNYWLLIFLIIDRLTADISLSPNATWEQNGITVAGWANGTNGFEITQLNAPFGISISNDAVLYIADTFNDRVVVVDLNLTSNISIIGSNVGQFDKVADVSVTNTSLYVLDYYNRRIQKIRLNDSNAVTVSGFNGLNLSFYLYVDTNDNIYVSDSHNHRVLLLLSNSSSSSVVAGIGVQGSNRSQLDTPYGIFVNQMGAIYIADHYNHRIMKWLPGASAGILVAGDGTNGNRSTQLYSPTYVIVDTNDYMYICEEGNARITRWIPNSTVGVCIVACTGTTGHGSTQLNAPISLAFDNQGSLYVSDRYNHRVQKFPIFRYRDPSYNQPKLSTCATWNSNAITFAYDTTIGPGPVTVFVSRNNTVYVTATGLNYILVWLEGSNTPTRNISGYLNNPYGVFATINGDIYVDNGDVNGRVDKWSWNATNSVVAMNGTKKCFALFVDTNDALYCSAVDIHIIFKTSVNRGLNALEIVAGNGTRGSEADRLYFPNGMFVDTNLNLYVADCGNHRIQFFQAGQRNATTKAGNGAPDSITLNWPTGVVLDADGNIFISDNDNHRIVKSGRFGFQCLFGCTNTTGLASNQLCHPHSLSFDSYGNLYVADRSNNRIQKFLLVTNSCASSYNQPTFSSYTEWNTHGITIANSSLLTTGPRDVFVDVNDTVYVADTNNNRVVAWLKGNTSLSRTFSIGLNKPRSVFAKFNGDIYVDNGDPNQHVERWTSNSTSSVVAMYVTQACDRLFIDTNENLYCVMASLHQVIKQSLSDGANTSSIIAAGNGIAGNASNMLNNPRGIFVDINLNLYVADCDNNRIQFFQSGELNAITMIINGSYGMFTLQCPTEIVLDNDSYLFIADAFNHRILGSGPTGFRCIVGCTNTSGSASNQLHTPYGLSFDSQGNLFVIDKGNRRLQKFMLSCNSCDETTSNPVHTTILQTTMVTTDTPTSSSVNQSCVSLGITLIPNTSSLRFPIQFRRNQDFYITSSIPLQCNISLSTIMQWTIYRCNSSNCSFPIQVDSTVQTALSEIYLPPRTLPYGIYELNLTVQLVLSSSVYVEIIPSGIAVNLLEYGTSMITHGYEQDLTLDPGRFSVDFDEDLFNASDWNYEYYCRINDPSAAFLSIENATIFNRTAWKFNNAIKSSITILNGSFLPNRTYEMMVSMENRRNSSVRVNGYLLIQVDLSYSPLILLGCVISSFCIAHSEFQRVNPTTQIALFSRCSENCSSIENITWKVYQGSNTGLSTIQWTSFPDNRWFFGSETSHLTVANEFFLEHSHITYWRFEVVYLFESAISSSALNFMINQAPGNGSCSIDPLTGTTTSLFTISCSNWFDEDGIKDYSLYRRTQDHSEEILIGFSSVAQFEVRLPCDDGNRSSLSLFLRIRDTLDCVTQLNITSVTIALDQSSITDLPLRLLSSGNQNTIAQVLTSIAQQFNRMNNEALEEVVASGIPALSISISPLASPTLPQNSVQMNGSALIEYNEQLNFYANLRDYLLTFTENLLVSTSTSILLQASMLVQLTQATNQLTRSSTIIASERCFQLAQKLSAMSKQIPVEDVQSASNQISQCTANVLTAINGPLQGRTIMLDLDFSRANQFPQDYDTDLESEWSNPKLFVDGNDFSWENIARARNLYCQQQTADLIHDQTVETTSLLTSALNVHLNLGQQFTTNTSSMFMSLETLSSQSLLNKTIQSRGKAQIHLPSNLSFNHQIVSLRSIVQPLASADKARMQSNTNLSTSISLSIFDENENEISLRTIFNHSIELIIPRDPNLIIPPMTLQNVTAFNLAHHHFLFNLHYIDLARKDNLTVSVHIEMKALNESIGYLMIYRFDHSPRLNSSITQIDGWSVFCPSSFGLSEEKIYRYFLDNHKTKDHQSLIFGFRELNSTELNQSCFSQSPNRTVPISDQPFKFHSNYQLRVYTSGCYYLDENNQWRSDGLLVGPLTNHNETQCFSTHLTTSASGF